MVVLTKKKNGSKTKSSIRNKTKFKSKTKSRTRKLMKGGMPKGSKISITSVPTKVYGNNGKPVKPSTTGSRFAFTQRRTEHNTRVGKHLKAPGASNTSFQAAKTPSRAPRVFSGATPLTGSPGKDVTGWVGANKGVGVPVEETGPTLYGKFRKLGVEGLPKIQAMSNQERIREDQFGFDPKPSDAPGGMTPTKQPYSLASPSLPNYSLASSGSEYAKASSGSEYAKASPSLPNYSLASSGSEYAKASSGSEYATASPSSTNYSLASPSSGYAKASSGTEYATASPSSGYSLASSDPIYTLASDKGVLEIRNPLYGEEKSAIAPNQGYFAGTSSTEYGTALSDPKYPSASSVPASSMADYLDPSIKPWKYPGFKSRVGPDGYTVFVPPKPLYTEVIPKELRTKQPQGPLYYEPSEANLPIYAQPIKQTGKEYATADELPSGYFSSTTTPGNYAVLSGKPIKPENPYANVYNVSKFKRKSGLKPGEEGYAKLNRRASKPEYVNMRKRGEYLNVSNLPRPKSNTRVRYSPNKNVSNAIERAIRNTNN
jgi:hypothetical protein